MEEGAVERVGNPAVDAAVDALRDAGWKVVGPFVEETYSYFGVVDPEDESNHTLFTTSISGVRAPDLEETHRMMQAPESEGDGVTIKSRVYGSATEELHYEGEAADPNSDENRGVAQAEGIGG